MSGDSTKHPLHHQPNQIIGLDSNTSDAMMLYRQSKSQEMHGKEYRNPFSFDVHFF